MVSKAIQRSSSRWGRFKFPKTVPYYINGVTALPVTSDTMKGTMDWLMVIRLHKYWPVISHLSYSTLVNLTEENIHSVLKKIGAEPLTRGANNRLLSNTKRLRERLAILEKLDVLSSFDEIADVFDLISSSPLSSTDPEPSGYLLLPAILAKINFLIDIHGAILFKHVKFFIAIRRYMSRPEVPNEDAQQLLISWTASIQFPVRADIFVCGWPTRVLPGVVNSKSVQSRVQPTKEADSTRKKTTVQISVKTLTKTSAVRTYYRTPSLLLKKVEDASRVSVNTETKASTTRKPIKSPFPLMEKCKDGTLVSSSVPLPTFKLPTRHNTSFPTTYKEAPPTTKMSTFSTLYSSWVPPPSSKLPTRHNTSFPTTYKEAPPTTKMSTFSTLYSGEATTLGSMTGAFPSKKVGATSLMYACQQGKDTQVINIVNTKPGAVLERERTLKTALHYCAESGDGGVSSAAVLLEAAPELVLAQDQDGYSALHLAVIAGNLALTKLLISHGAPVNMPDNEGHTPAHWATVCGEIDCLELLLGKGCDPNMGDMHGGCPLHYAAQMCGPFSDMPADRRLGMAALRILLDSSSDPNLPDNHGRQPILWAASAGSSEAILVLVGAGASVAAADKDGLTALHCAASRGHTDCVETLINLCSAEPDVIDNNGCSALFYAVTLGHADATQTLLNHGSSTNRQDRKGRTAVHCGAAKGQLETLKVVAAWGGNMWQKTVRGDYPLHDAVASGRRPLVHWLLSQRPDSVNSPNNDGRCPLHIAAIHNNIEMCKTLLDAGSLVNPVMRTAKGALATPLDAALHKGHRGCAKYLQLHGGVPASRLNSESAALRGLSSNRGEGNRTSVPHISKEQLEEKLEAVEEVEVQTKPEMKPPLTETPTSDDHYHVTEKERLPSSTRPHILQVYVEDDLMIRKLRHYEGSDSSIEERVRRRRRKRKTKLMSEREKSAPPRISPRRMSSSDETVDPKRSAYAKDQADTHEKDTMVEKLVQTEFSVQPDSLQSHFESLIIESIKEDEMSSQQADQSNQLKETKPDKKPSQGTSSGDSDKKGSVQIVEAVVHKEQKSGESDGHKTSSKEHKTSEEEHKTSSGEHKTSSEERKASSEDQSKTTVAQTKETKTEQLNDISKQSEPLVVSENSSETLGDKKLPETKITEGSVKEDTTNIEKDANRAGQTTSVGEAKDSQKVEDVKSETKSDKDISISQQTVAGSNESGLPQIVTTKGTQGQGDTGNQQGGDKTDVQSDRESKGRKVPNDKLVAQVLFQSMQEDEMLSPNQPSSLAVNGGSKDVKEEKQGGAEASHEEHKPTQQIVETEQKSILHQVTAEDKLTTKVAPQQSTNVKEHDTKEVQFSTVERTNALGSDNNNAIIMNNESFIRNEVSHDAKHDSLASVQSGNKVAGSEHPADYFYDQNNFSKDSFDIEGSLDELTLNMTKDSDDLPPELSLPEPIVNENWDKTLEADRVAADVLLANEDRGLLKVLGDPTGGSSYVADKRRKLRKKREGNKKWMNSRSTESFEVLKISDEKTDEEGVSDVDKPHDDGIQEKATGKENIQRSPSEQRKISRPCRRGYESSTDVALSTVSVTQAVQYSVRKYHLERRIFHQLLELKRLQIRAGRASEAVLVKRLVDEYKRAGLMLGLQQYDGVYTFRSFEKFLYEQLRLLQTSERRIIPRLRSTDDLERLTAALRKTRVGQEILASVPNNPALCTYQTHRCHHATHAYTGIPCAAYIARPNHHTMPKPTTYTGFLPRLVNDENQAEVAKTLRHVDPSRPLTLELSHGPDKQVITLPTEKLDKSKKYFVTFTIKSGNQRKNDMKHSHATSI